MKSEWHWQHRLYMTLKSKRANCAITQNDLINGNKCLNRCFKKSFLPNFERTILKEQFRLVRA